MQDNMKQVRLTLLFAVHELLEEVLSYALVRWQVNSAIDRTEEVTLLLVPILSGEFSCIHQDFLCALADGVLLVGGVHFNWDSNK